MPTAIAVAAFAIPTTCTHPRGSLEAETQLRSLQQALALYAVERGDCPAVLEALETRGYVDEPIMDPWGRPIDYRCTDVTGGRSVLLRSRGADGRNGTDDDVIARQRISW